MRYRNLVKKVDAGEMSPKDFVIALFGWAMRDEPFNYSEHWHLAWASARIYIEDGGRKYTPVEFLKSIDPKPFEAHNEGEITVEDFAQFLNKE